MIKVLHFIPNYNFGGIESLFIDLYKKINKNEFSVSLLVESESSKESIEYLRNLGCDVHVIEKLDFKNPLKYLKNVKNILASKEIDIIHSHSSSRSYYIFLVAKKLDIKNRILHAHTTKSADQPLKALLYNILNFLGVKNATKLLAVSQKAGKYFYGNNDFLILNNGVETKKFGFNQEKRIIIRKKLELNENFIVGHVGRFTEAKNHRFIIDVFYELKKIIPNAQLLLVGDGELKEDIMNYANFKKITNNVLFYGQSNNVEDLYQIMDYFVFPSIYEGFPLTMIEAQASGLQILVSDRVTESIKLTNLVNFESLDSSATEWANYIFKTRQYERINNNIIMKKSGYDINENIKKTEEIYRSLFNRS